MKLTEDQVLERIRRYVSAQGSQQAAARALGVSPSYLNDVLHQRREPTDRVLASLKIRVVRSYEEVRS